MPSLAFLSRTAQPDRVLRFLILLTLAVSLFPAEAEVLRTAAEVASYPGNDEDQQPMVELEAMVTFMDPTGTIFLADETGATFLTGVNRNRINLKPGDRIEVNGKRHPGLFIGGISPRKITTIGKTPLPPPRSVGLAEIASGKFHYQIVAVEGIARGVRRTGETSATLDLALPGGRLDVHFDNAPADMEAFTDARLRISGLAAGGIDDRRRLVDPYLKVISPEQVEVLEEAPEYPPEVKVASLSKGWENPPHRVVVSGVALSPMMDGSFFIRDETGALKITPSGRKKVEPGMEVVAIGFPEKGDFSPFLDRAELELGSDISFPEMTVVNEEIINSSSLDGELVKLKGTLLGTNPYSVMLGDREIQVVPPAKGMPELEAGSKLRLTGIWQVTETKMSGFSVKPSGFTLLLRSSDDVEVISAPPWWDSQKLGILLAVISVGAVLALVWAALLQVQVSKQVKLIEAKTQEEAVAEERQRIAREFHDTLEQELAGLSIRLDAVRTRVPDGAEADLLGQLGKIVSRLQTETRDFINDLRGKDQAPFPEALAALMEHLRGTTRMRLELEKAEGQVPPRIAHHLLRVAREAVNNAVKYSGAESVSVAFENNVLTISDSGRGFDPASIPPGHFGVQGIRERCKKISAVCEIVSSPGNGTTLRIVLPNIAA